MDLSVIIVNYNVKYFLEQALLSVRKACAQLETEVFVVDNNSVDGSVQLVREKFPEVILIANKDNLGFSKANNQAMRIAKGRYFLLLNPDTVVEEDTFTKVVQFMDAHPQGGGLGVKMVDGKGIFLPESKRGLPTPSVAFFKIFGLSALFPKSKLFGKYHLGYLDDEEIHEIEILAGAFMLMRKEALDKVGLLDEDFFMYGEDIDLSYRIIKGGYKNYYYPKTTIIHYKGESTKKGSLNYVRIFYNAMIIFARKHFSAGRASMFSFFIQTAVYLRAIVSLAKQFVLAAALPILDLIAMGAGMFFLKNWYQNNFKAAEGLVYPQEFLTVNVPLYLFIWVASIFFAGGYDKPSRFDRVVSGVIIGTVIISAVYGFLNEEYRFSRALILLGAVWAIFSLVLIRAALRLVQNKSLSLATNKSPRLVIVGQREETDRVYMLLSKAEADINYIGYVTPEGLDGNESKLQESHLGSLQQLKEIAEIYRIDEIVFCAKDISSQKTIELMTSIGREMDYKIAPMESLSIIGSNSKNTAGDLYTVEIKFNINDKAQRRNKRIMDLALAVTMIPVLPLLFFLVRKPLGLITNLLKVLLGKRSWVGYDTKQDPSKAYNLPRIRLGVLSPLDAFPQKNMTENTVYRLNLLYAKDYELNHDLEIIFRGWRGLGD